MEFYRTLLNDLDGYQKISSAVQEGRTPVLATGLNAIHKCHMTAALWKDSGRGLMILTNDEPAANRMVEDINGFLGENTAVLYPYCDFTFRQVDGASREYEHARLKVLGSIAQGECPIVVASAQAALQYTIPVEKLKESIRRLAAGETMELEKLLSFLVASGYERAERVEGVCQFSQRGGILDVYPPQSANPIRIEFWGDDIDCISTFSVDTQRREEDLEEVFLTPAKEVLFESPEYLMDLLWHAKKSVRGKNAATVKEHLDHDIERLEAGLGLEYIDRYLS